MASPLGENVEVSRMIKSIYNVYKIGIVTEVQLSLKQKGFLTELPDNLLKKSSGQLFRTLHLKESLSDQDFNAGN